MAYEGFEQGPIRPPSEAGSLLIRVTRNCPWNKCKFCPVYKGTKFSRRPLEDVLRDIDSVAAHVHRLRGLATADGQILRSSLEEAYGDATQDDLHSLSAAWHWLSSGMRSIFLQDANSLLIPPAEMVTILNRLREHFPWVDRITSYSRSQTIAKLSDEEMRAIAEAGLNRIHIGFESGSDQVLALVKKGATKAVHIEAGRRVKQAGIELSAYYMPGLGGKALWRENALDTADLMNQVDPEFIRIRTLAIPDHVPLAEDLAAGTFEKQTDVETSRELLLFLENLHGITSAIRSDHILNLFQDVEGQLPGDLPKMQDEIRRFLELPVERQVVYQMGRRNGIFTGLDDLDDERRSAYAEEICRQLGATPDNVDAIVDELVKRFI